MQRRWIIVPTEHDSNVDIAWPEICNLPCIAALLKRKGFKSPEALDAFLRPRLSSLSDPFLLAGMDAAVARIFHALDHGERIVLFGDYDVDGVTALALLYETLTGYGTTPELFLPLRIEEGYGMSRESVDRCLAQHHPELLIAVDCGTSSVAEIDQLKSRGVDVIVLDHHEPKSALPDCVALVNPKAEIDSTLHYLCSVGLAFKLSHALLKERSLPRVDLRASLDLVALGTVADLVPLREENRIFVRRGIVEIARSKRPGLRTLMKVASVHPPIRAEDIAFRLGPRLNAAGRLATAEKALQLLLTQDEEEAIHLAALLDEQNRDRQNVEKQIFGEADGDLESGAVPGDDSGIVVGRRGWHPGVLGIVAARLSRKYNRPTVVVGFDSSGVGKGSARSIEGLSLVETLGCCHEWLEKFGGHEMAAGLTVQEEKFPAFIKAFKEAARQLVSAEDLQPRLRIDHEVTFAELNSELLQWHQVLEPFGSGNQLPVFFARTVLPVRRPEVLKEKHLILRLKQNNHFRRAIFFYGALSPLPSPPWDIAFRLNADVYQGETRLQIHVEALREAAPIT